MRFARILLASLALVAGVSAARVAGSAEPGCNKWDLEVSCRTDPSRVIVTDPFTATVTVRNAGDVALANVTVQLRGDLNAKVQAGAATPSLMIEKLEPGETKELSAVFVCDVVGMTRVIGGARDALGWAASNCACTVDVIGLPAIQSEMTDKDIGGKEKGIFVVGETFTYALQVQNDAGTTVTPDLKVVYTLPKELEFVSGTADNNVTVTGSGQAAESSTFVLAPNQTLTLTITVKVLTAPPSNLVQARASIQTTGGVEVAQETESTTVKN